METLQRGVTHESAWRTEGERVLNVLCAFMDRVLRLCETMIQPVGQLRAADVRGAIEAVDEVHSECKSMLGHWVERWAAALSAEGKSDASRGGFDALTVALEDGYHGACLAYLTVLGLSFHATKVAGDGLVEKVEQAYGLAVAWNQEATVFARSLTDDPKPRSPRVNREMYSIYRARVPDEARAAYTNLHPYLDQLNNRPDL
jgi:hypothetical protein